MEMPSEERVRETKRELEEREDWKRGKRQGQTKSWRREDLRRENWKRHRLEEREREIDLRSRIRWLWV